MSLVCGRKQRIWGIEENETWLKGSKNKAIKCNVKTKRERDQGWTQQHLALLKWVSTSSFKQYNRLLPAGSVGLDLLLVVVGQITFQFQHHRVAASILHQKIKTFILPPVFAAFFHTMTLPTTLWEPESRANPSPDFTICSFYVRPHK